MTDYYGLLRPSIICQLMTIQGELRDSEQSPPFVGFFNVKKSSVSATSFGNAAQDYLEFRRGFPRSIFERLALFGVGMDRQTIVDLGTGTGSLARGFALRGCNVIGIDPDTRMLDQARKLDNDLSVQIEYLEGRAEHTGLEASTADVVSAGQCWHWFDREQATKETLRILKRPGKLVIAHFDWLPIAGNVVEATERMIEEHNPAWTLGGRQGMYPEWLPGLATAGFINIESLSYDLDVPYTTERWRGRIRASAGVASLDDDVRMSFEESFAMMLEKDFPAPNHEIPHRVFVVVSEAV